GRLHQHAVALGDAELLRECCGHGSDPRFHLRPGPFPVAPDEANTLRITAGRLGQEMGEVHHPCRGGDQPAFGCFAQSDVLLISWLAANGSRGGPLDANILASFSSTCLTSWRR